MMLAVAVPDVGRGWRVISGWRDTASVPCEHHDPQVRARMAAEGRPDELQDQPTEGTATC